MAQKIASDSGAPAWERIKPRWRRYANVLPCQEVMAASSASQLRSIDVQLLRILEEISATHIERQELINNQIERLRKGLIGLIGVTALILIAVIVGISQG